jgi:DNA-binding NarL/FixJ family response regulator
MVPVNVVVAIKNDLLRYGVERMLQGLDVVAELRVRDGLTSAIDAAVDPRTDLLVVPLTEIAESDVPVLRDAEERGIRILMLLDDTELGRLGQLSGIRGSGFLTTGELSGDVLSDTLTRMSGGEVPLPSGLARNLLAMAGEVVDPVSVTPRMTPREQQVLVLLVEGLSNKQIARQLGISEHVAKRLVSNILAKMNCSNRTLAAARAIRDGLYELYAGRAEPS